MHDVREAFDLHEALDPHCALLGNAAEIIAAEVHEHDVLGFFLGIGEQFLLELHILFRRVPPAARSGDGGELQGILLAAHHDFGRRAEEGDVGEVHVEHVGRSVEAAQPAVEGEGVAAVGNGEPHGGNNLNGFALGEHAADALDVALEAFLAGLSQDLRIGRGCFGGVDAGLMGAADFPEGASAHLDETVVEMVEHEDGAGEDQLAFGLGGGHHGSELLIEEAGHFEAEVAVQAARDGGKIKAFRSLDSDAAHESLESVREGHSFKFLQGREPVIIDTEAELSVLAGNLKQHVAGQNAVAAPASVDRRAFKKNAVARAGHTHEKADGRIHVCWQYTRFLMKRDAFVRFCHRTPSWSVSKKKASPFFRWRGF